MSDKPETILSMRGPEESKKKFFNERTGFHTCRGTTIAIFVLIVLADLTLLAIRVHNDKPSISTEFSQISEFPLPVISMQLGLKFKISCYFRLFNGIIILSRVVLYNYF